MIQIIPPQRTSDKHGSGHFGASRGSRKHNGVDLACYPGSYVTSHVDGEVTKLGYPYAKHLEYRYVEITDHAKLKHRFFYIAPFLEEGDHVVAGSIIGASQELGRLYDGITEHIHYEIKDQAGNYINPNDYLITYINLDR